MKTLIELYDERPLDNVLATEMFGPEETVFICPPEVAANKGLKAALRRYVAHRGCRTVISFVPASLLDANKVEKALRKVLKEKEDCAIDISGGTDAALFAAGAVSEGLPVFTYSRQKNAFFEIQNAPFAKEKPCTVKLDVEACFLMAGGQLLPGRADNSELAARDEEISRLFSVYSAYRRIWNRQVSYIQKLPSLPGDALSAAGKRTAKADNSRVTADADLFHALEDSGLISRLRMDEEEISFRFPDETVRFWLRDMGSALELFVYQACVRSGCFDDVVLSAVVNWEGSAGKDGAVTNEIDVVAVRGVQPLLISCKTCEIKTEALNELAILRDRFGGKGSRAMIVSSATRGNAVMRRRAAELDIEVVEWNDFRYLSQRLRKG